MISRLTRSRQSVIDMRRDKQINGSKESRDIPTLIRSIDFWPRHKVNQTRMGGLFNKWYKKTEYYFGKTNGKGFIPNI